MGDAVAVDGGESTDIYSLELHVDPLGKGCAGMTGPANTKNLFLMGQAALPLGFL